MKKILMFITAIAIALSVNAQMMCVKQDTIKTFSVDSMQVPQFIVEQGLTPSFYMESAFKARLVSLASIVIGCGAEYALSYTNSYNISLFNDNASIAIGVITGGVALISWIYSVSCDYKAAKAMSSIKFTGNGVSVSF